MKKYVSVLLGLALFFTSFTSYASFPDIDSATLEWAGEAISKLTAQNVISGYPDGTFCPGGNVTRAEFAKMTVAAFDSEEVNTAYTDISGHWAEKYINSVNMYTQNNKFRPDEYATRADVAYAMAKLIENVSKNSDILSRFSDCDTLADDLKPYFATAVETGVIKGYEDGTARPYGNVTRAEAAVIIYRCLGIKSSVDTPATEDGITSDGGNKTEQPTEKPDTGNTDRGEDEKDHIYSLYPGADLILITSVSASSNENEEDTYRINYRLASEEKEYSSVIPADTTVAGLKTDASKLRPGDVITMNTAFHGYIGSLYVHASFGEDIPLFDNEITEYKKGTYTMKSGKIKSMSFSGKTASLVLDTYGGDDNVIVMKKTDVNVFSPWKKNGKWWFDSLDYIDFENEDVYIYIRYTNGISTEILVSDMIRN